MAYVVFTCDPLQSLCTNHTLKSMLLCVCVTELMASDTGGDRGLASNKMDGSVMGWAAGGGETMGRVAMMANAISTSAFE